MDRLGALYASLLIVGISLLSSPLYGALPADAQKYLQMLPQRKVTLPFVIARSIQSSDSFKAIAAESISFDVANLRANQIFDTKLSLGVDYLSDGQERPNAFSPADTKAWSFKTNISKYFPTGTGVSLELGDGHTEYTVAGSLISFAEATSVISVSQSLWKDSFGFGSRKSRQAGKLLSASRRANYTNQVEDWTLQLTELFYSSWLAQENARAARESVGRRERLVAITKRKRSRGTAEESDVLQVESLLLDNKAKLAEAELTLGNRWRDLVIALKLKSEWMYTIDPKDVPVALDNPVPESIQICGSESRPKQAPTSSPTTEAARLRAEAAALQSESSKNAAAPDLQLSASVFTNGTDSQNTTAASEMLSAKHVGWSVGLSLAIPLSGATEEASIREAVTNRIRSEAQAAIENDMLKRNWILDCANLHRTVRTFELRQRAFRNQKKRATLDRKRFAIGRVPTITMVQAEDDATLAEIELHNAEISMRRAAWKVKKTAGNIPKYLNKLKRELAYVQRITQSYSRE